MCERDRLLENFINAMRIDGLDIYAKPVDTHSDLLKEINMAWCNFANKKINLSIDCVKFIFRAKVLPIFSYNHIGLYIHDVVYENVSLPQFLFLNMQYNFLLDEDNIPDFLQTKELLNMNQVLKGYIDDMNFLIRATSLFDIGIEAVIEIATGHCMHELIDTINIENPESIEVTL